VNRAGVALEDVLDDVDVNVLRRIWAWFGGGALFLNYRLSEPGLWSTWQAEPEEALQVLDDRRD